MQTTRCGDSVAAPAETCRQQAAELVDELRYTKFFSLASTAVKRALLADNPLSNHMAVYHADRTVAHLAKHLHNGALIAF